MDVGRAVGNNRSYSYSALFHPLALACRNVWTVPDPDTAGDLAPPHAVAQRLREDHLRTLASSPFWAAQRAVGCRRGILKNRMDLRYRRPVAGGRGLAKYTADCLSEPTLENARGAPQIRRHATHRKRFGTPGLPR